MGREDFVNRIKVDQEVIDKCVNVSRDFSDKLENGQYNIGQNEQELARTTGWERDGESVAVQEHSNNLGLNESKTMGMEVEDALNAENMMSIESAIDTTNVMGVEGAIGVDEGMSVEGDLNVDDGIAVEGSMLVDDGMSVGSEMDNGIAY